MPSSRTAVDRRLTPARATPADERSLLARLTRRAVRGDERAFEEIFRAYHQEIYRYCLAILHNPGDAEDAMQATMVAALRALPGEEREIALKPWLYRVAHNEAISLLRDRQEPVAAEEVVEPSGDPVGTDAEQRERMRALVGDLKSLPDRQRGALVMRELSGLAYEEIGASLGCSEAAARQVVYEARVSLKTRSEGREMSCEETRRALSDGDRRRLRGRKLKAHLAACERCQDFRAAIDTRRTDFQALCPALPAAAASGILAGLVGAASANASAAAAGGGAVASGAVAGVGGAGAAAAGAGGAAAGLATAGAVKGASVAAAVLIAAGAGEATGVVDLPGPVELGREAKQAAPVAAGGGASEEAGATGKPGSERALEAREQGKAASAAKGDNRAERAVEARAKRGHKGKPGQKGRQGRGKGKPQQPGSNGVGQGGPPPGVGGGQPGGGPPATPAPQAPPTGGGGGSQGGGSPAAKGPGPPPSAGKPEAKPSPPSGVSPPRGGPSS